MPDQTLPKREARCEVCRFAQPLNGHGDFQCRRHAPIAAHDPRRNVGVYPEAFAPRWPCVDDNHWCGDFELLEATRAPA